MQNPLISTGIVARRLGISENRVRQLAHSGLIHVALVTAAGERLYDPAHVERIAIERAQRQRKRP